MERAEQGIPIKQIGLGWSYQSKKNQRREYLVDKIEVRILDRIGLDQSKQIVLEQDDHSKHRRAEESNKIREDNSSLRKCPEG